MNRVGQAVCWNDTFDDETKIAYKHDVLVEDGDVVIDLENAPMMVWHSDSSLVSGLGDIGANSKPAIAYNITGDGRWNLIAGEEDGVFNGYYWNGSQWVSDSSLVTGLGDIGSRSAPAIAYNITGDGRWNLIAGEFVGVFNGYYWNGSQWVSDSSLVTGLGDVGYRSAPAIAYNITGDGRWNLIAGEYDGVFNGYYWNGMQWVRDSSLVTGLGDIGSSSAPAIAYNITGDGGWNIIAGEGNGAFYGFKRKAVASLMSDIIQPPYFKGWTVFNANDTVPAGTSITYKILDAVRNTIMPVIDGQDISGITQTAIRLYAELATTDISKTPVLHDWSVCYKTGKAAELLPTAIEIPPALFANRTNVIGAVIFNAANVTTPPFNASLSANGTVVSH